VRPAPAQRLGLTVSGDLS